MSILNVDKIQPIGSGSTVTVNATDTILTNAQAGVITATSFSGTSSGNPTLTNGSNNRVITATGSNALTGEANLTFDGTQLVVQGGSGTQHMFRHSAGWGGVTSAGSAGGSGAGFSLANNYNGTLETKWSIYLDGSNDGLRFTANTPDQTSDEKLRIDSSGRVGISTNAPSSALLDIATASGSNDHLRLRRLSSDSNVATNWSLKPYAGNLYFRSGGSSDKIYFDDNGDIVIMDGNLVIGTAGHGIDFSAQTASSASGVTTNNETLDHFEEGTWTPTQATLGSWASGAEIDGKYQRVGNWVTASFIVKYASNGSAIAASIDGLPFANNNTGSSYKQGGFVSYATNSNVSSFLIENGGSRIYIYTNSGSTYQLTNMDNVEVRGTVIYRVA